MPPLVTLILLLPGLAGVGKFGWGVACVQDWRSGALAARKEKITHKLKQVDGLLINARLTSACLSAQSICFEETTTKFGSM
jgi:hypothetical protein